MISQASHGASTRLIHIADLQINAILGVGAFGITYLVTDPAIGTRFALKEYLPSTTRDTTCTMARFHLPIMTTSGHSVRKAGLKLFSE